MTKRYLSSMSLPGAFPPRSSSLEPSYAKLLSLEGPLSEPRARRQSGQPKIVPSTTLLDDPAVPIQPTRPGAKQVRPSRALLTSQQRERRGRKVNQRVLRGRPKCRQRAGGTQRDADGASMTEGSYREASPAKLVPSSSRSEVSRTRPCDRQTNPVLLQIDPR